MFFTENGDFHVAIKTVSWLLLTQNFVFSCNFRWRIQIWSLLFRGIYSESKNFFLINLQEDHCLPFYDISSISRAKKVP